MMINKRLLKLVPESVKYIFYNVLIQWVSLIVSIILMYNIAFILSNEFSVGKFVVILLGIIIKVVLIYLSNKASYLSMKEVKRILRNKIYDKLLKLGISYQNEVNTSEIIQLSTEGVDQLEIYFGKYLPQFFYATLAPITLFIVVGKINLMSAIVLFICVPLIPITIIIIQKWAKKLLAKYWGQYTKLGDSFLENIQGLTTLKIYEADEFKNEEMNREAEHFRKITMKVLTMQLNSITIMDFITYLGVGLGIIISIVNYNHGNINLLGCLWIILLAADFFLPMRLLGSYFHIAMNGMAASDKIFKLLDLNEIEDKNGLIKSYDIKINDLSFGYMDVDVLKHINLDIKENAFIGIVGESGSGKSTLAKLISGINKNYRGSLVIGENEVSDINERLLLDQITYIGNNSHLFKGTVRENLLYGSKAQLSDDKLWDVLNRVNLDKFLKAEKGLDTLILENGSNISGGQRQRLALARALLHDSKIYIFDETTSNIDAESEKDILSEIKKLNKDKTVIMISHRLMNVVDCEEIFVLNRGNLIEHGKHLELLANNGYYKELWDQQFAYESFRKYE